MWPLKAHAQVLMNIHFLCAPCIGCGCKPISRKGQPKGEKIRALYKNECVYDMCVGARERLVQRACELQSFRKTI